LKDSHTKLHVSFDVDACSASYLIGTGTPSNYGLTKREIIYVMQNIYRSNKLVSFDLVEVNH